MYMQATLGCMLFITAFSCWSQDTANTPVTAPETVEPAISNVRPDSSKPRKVWVLPPRTAREIREQAWRNRTSVQFMEPVYSATGEPAFRKISVNCFEPSVSIQYMEDRRLYNGLYIQDVGGWNDERISGRRLPIDVEPTSEELQRYLQRGCSGQIYNPIPW